MAERHCKSLSACRNVGTREIGLSTVASQVAAGIPLAIATLVLVTSCGVRAGNIFVLPESFHGWVIIRYNVEGEAAFDREGWKTLIRVPISGSISTRGDRDTGYGLDEYYFEDSHGKRRRIQIAEEDCQTSEVCVQQFHFVTSPSVVTLFFVGTKGELSETQRPEVY